MAEFSDIPDNPRLLDVTPVARAAIDDFLNGEFDEVYLAYTDFVNMLRQETTVKRLLPLQPTEVDTQAMGEYVKEVSVEPGQ